MAIPTQMTMMSSTLLRICPRPKLLMPQWPVHPIPLTDHWCGNPGFGAVRKTLLARWVQHESYLGHSLWSTTMYAFVCVYNKINYACKSEECCALRFWLIWCQYCTHSEIFFVYVWFVLSITFICQYPLARSRVPNYNALSKQLTLQ